MPATPDDAPYLHYTSNNTIYGTQYHHDCRRPPPPRLRHVQRLPLSRPVDVSPYPA
ncbi:MAG: hypothetical protein R3F43_20975 [bacterium]